MKNYGLIFPEIRTREQGAEHILGGLGSIDEKIINPSGNWFSWLPAFEPQKRRFDTYGCTIFGTNNAEETLQRFTTGKDVNNSERYPYIGSDTVPGRGNDPHKVADWMNKNGFIKEELLPFTDSMTLEEFNSPKPLPDSLIQEGRKFNDIYEFRHKWVWNGTQSPQNKKKLLQEALKRGTVCVSVTAWKKRQERYYKDANDTDNHWCQLVSYDDFPVIFDSYADNEGDPHIKTLEDLYDFQIAKVFYLEDVKEKLGIIQQILNAIGKLIPILGFLVKKHE